MRTDSGDLVTIFNGEIYNHAELRAELESLGHRFRTRCDTEVALKAFHQWDIQCFSRFRGMFALAFWRESEKRLVLGRDRLGIKPLYIHQRHGELYFGSELKTLLAHPEIPRVLDQTGLRYFLAMNYVPGPHTLVEGIEKLPPGSLLEWRDGQTRIEPYWAVDFHPQPIALEDAKEQLDTLLRSSVREHLVSDVPLGVWSSGGLDSSTVLHYAAEASGAKLKTFSISFSGRECDESVYFREAARIYGTEHHELDLNPELELADTIEELSYYSDEPSADAGALPVWYLSRMSRSHVTVALSGDGGDELFGGYLTYCADRWARTLRHTPESVRSLGLSLIRHCWPVSDAKISFEYKLKRMLEGSLLPPDEAHFFWNGTGSPAQIRKLCPGVKGHGPDLQSLFDGLPSSSETGYLNRYLLADHQYYLPDDILYKVDRMSMAHSLEVRPPLLDHRIVEFAARLPENLKLRAGSQKVILKELMKDKLPASIVNRKKSGFDVPAHEWFRSTLRPLLLDTVTPRAVADSGIFDPAAVQSMIRDHMERRVNVGYHLWGLLTLFLWMKRWGIQAGTPTPSSRPAQAATAVLAN